MNEQPFTPMPEVSITEGTVEFWTPVMVTLNQGYVFNGQARLDWGRTDPYIVGLTVHDRLGQTRELEIPRQALQEVIEDRADREAPTGLVQVWRSGKGVLTIISRNGNERLMFQLPISRVVSFLSAVDSCRRAFGEGHHEDMYVRGAVAALEMLANGGLK